MANERYMLMTFDPNSINSPYCLFVTEYEKIYQGNLKSSEGREIIFNKKVPLDIAYDVRSILEQIVNLKNFSHNIRMRLDSLDQNISNVFN